MKKVNKAASNVTPPNVDEDDYELPAEFDFTKLVRVKAPRVIKEGQRVFINGAPFVARGRGFVPDPDPTDNGKRSRKKH